MTNEPKMEELILEDLGYNDIKIYQMKNGYHFTSDAIALANYVTVKKDGLLLDMCSGSGVVGILAGAKNKVNFTVFAEIQEKVARMCKMSCCLNNMDNTDVMNCKIQGLHKQLKNVQVDTIVCNPPYFKADKTKVSDNDEVAISKHEIKVTLKEIIYEAGKILKDGGKFYLSIKASRLAEAMEYLRSYKLEPKEMKILPECKKDQTILIKAIKKGEVGLTIQLS